MSRILAAVIAALFVFSALPATAATTGVVRGTVTVNGSPQAGVAIALTGEGSTLRGTSDAGGTYVFPQVPFGSYTLSASYTGVKTLTQPVVVASDEVLVLNLALGALKTIANLNVTSRAGVTGTPVSQNAVTKRQLEALPSNNSLNSIIETVPGIVKFSYNEPVAHGFHGVSYELDGAPLPQATSSNFAELVDPKSIDSVEIFTGAMPAEYGGSRSGAVINIISNRASDLSVPYQGSLTLGGGNFGQRTASFDTALKSGKSELFFSANTQNSDRGLDAPTYSAIHDNNSQSDFFLRTITTFNDRQSLAFDFSNQIAQFQIPINTDPANDFDPQFSVPGTDDVQREYDRYASMNFTSSSADGSRLLQIVPWLRYTRIAYDGDLANEVLGLTNLGPDANNPAVNDYLAGIGLRQDRHAQYVGLRASELFSGSRHTVKAGFDTDREILSANETFACYDSTCNTIFNTPNAPPPPGGYTAFDTAQDRAGSQFGAYVQDKWTPSKRLSLAYGLRYDASTGYTGGNQISPRIGANYAIGQNDILHAYYGRFYAAPQLEDVRQACVALQGCAGTPSYDLRPQTDAYSEIGLSHTFSPSVNGYVNVWQRNSSNVLDTTQLLNTPLFAVFNNAIGRAHGIELRLQGTMPNTDSWFFSGALASSQAAGVSGSTFLFPPDEAGFDNLIAQLAPEDHDQRGTINAAYTHRF
ncbi:MAG TPA: TonB-dependent receptor, partial [Candidatus Baltobacteraceae bacterium]|nr:TonB-dependent receptor [Candidatus Baltobacteraceae bacterium]